MSVTSSPQQAMQAPLGRRSATIPKDQLDILNEDGAWSIDPVDRQGVPHLPAHILHDVRLQHLQEMQARKTNPGHSLSLPDDKRAGKADHGGDDDGTKDASEHDVDNEEQDANQSRHSSPERMLDWTPSPPRPPPRRISAPQFQSQIVRDTPHLGSEYVDASSTSRYSAPMQPAHRSHHYVEPVEEEEEEEEEEMEVDLPEAHGTSESRVNLESARVQIASTPTTGVPQPTNNGTPSCAQPDSQVIPGTVLPKKAPVSRKGELERRKHRRMQPIQFEGTTPVKRANPSSHARLPNTSRLADVDSSMGTSSSSLIPATCATNSTQNSTAGVTPIPQPPVTRAPQFNSSALQPRPIIENLAIQIQPVTSLPKDPYSLFKSTYPTYTTSHAGTLKNFLKAIICLEYLQELRALREFLFDDFIRAFSSGYLQYVKNAGPGQTPLPAIEWFSLLEGKPEFSQMIITQRSIKPVLELYPELVSSLRRSISGLPSKTDPRKSEQSETRETMDIDSPAVQSPELSPPGPAKPPRRPSVPSPELGSDAPEPPNLVPTSSARSVRAPSASQYFEKMKSESRSSLGRPRLPDYQAKLREYLKRTRAKGGLSPGSSRQASATSK